MTTVIEKKEIKAPSDLGMVLYTDGGWKEVGGWGLHGYTYNAAEPLERVAKKNDIPSTKGYVEQAKLENKDVNAIKPLSYVDGWGSMPYKCSNNTAEVKAALEGVKIAKKYSANELTILSDSEYLIKGIKEGYYRWEKDGWVKPDGTPRANQEVWKELIKEVEDLKQNGKTIHWYWVRGHSDNLGNDNADSNATRGRILAAKGIEFDTVYIEDPNGYWKEEADYNRLFAQPCWYFCINQERHKSSDGRYVYYTGNHTNSVDQFGKVSTDHSYTVLFLKEPEPVLEAVMEYQETVAKSDNQSTVVAFLKHILSAKVYTELKEHGMQYVVKHQHQNDLYSITKKQLTWEARPPKRAQYAMMAFGHMFLLLEDYLAGKTDKTCLTDITELLFDYDEKKGVKTGKLKKALVKQASVSVPVSYNVSGTVEAATLTLTYNLDLPQKNSLSSIAKMNPKVLVMTYRESAHGFRYLTIIETADDISIWSSVHSNLKLIN